MRFRNVLVVVLTAALVVALVFVLRTQDKSAITEAVSDFTDSVQEVTRGIEDTKESGSEAVDSVKDLFRAVDELLPGGDD